MNNYKCRAECKIDLITFVGIANWKKQNVRVTKSKKWNLCPDLEIEFESALSLDEIREIMSGVDDGHVMYQTVQLAKNYTGERNYDLHPTQPESNN